VCFFVCVRACSCAHIIVCPGEMGNTKTPDIYLQEIAQKDLSLTSPGPFRNVYAMLSDFSHASIHTSISHASLPRLQNLCFFGGQLPSIFVAGSFPIASHDAVIIVGSPRICCIYARSRPQSGDISRLHRYGIHSCITLSFCAGIKCALPRISLSLHTYCFTLQHVIMCRPKHFHFTAWFFSI